LHTAGGAQSASTTQVDLQAATPQRNGKQETAAGVTQVPAPSQVDWRVSVVVPAGQLAATQAVPSAYLWQAPASHLPFVSQLVASRSTQVCAGSGAPVGTFEQIPIEPDSAQDRHALVHAVAQQTPCAQLFDVHSSPLEQNAPFGFLPHELPTQTFPEEQFASAVQAPKHWLPLQVYGTQVTVLGATQAPVALQVDSGVKTLFSQRSGAQIVPMR
jgi:hypothetical protein